MNTVKSTLNRRQFLQQGTILTSGSFILGFQVPVQADSKVTVSAPLGSEPLMTDAFIRIDTDNTITLLMNHAEFGNGVYTSVAMMVAEELDIDWELLRWEAAPTEPAYFSPIFGEYLTAGSVSTAGAFVPMRIAGAKTRALLLAAAARYWQVSKETLTAL